ncbi:MAG: glycosyltransferase [Gammaproteobacteria bacterium]|nr:glycosyltransferase [Gammaproteobacteria bacterium]
MQDLWVALPGLLLWITLLILPWRPWSTRESLDAKVNIELDLSNITVLVPARDEAITITRTLKSISEQGNIHQIILIDDQSTDNTAKIASATGIENLVILKGKPLPESWSGKLWALEQGLAEINTDYVLLLDADIELLPGTLKSLLNKAQTDNRDLVSLMASLRMHTAWEKLLMPAFIYFFKLLYPFAISNSDNKYVAAAAGGCVLIKTSILRKIGGFQALKHELIDDCSLARKIKQNHGRIWIGLTRSAISHREYIKLSMIWNMVTRTAFTQLSYSVLFLVLCSVLMTMAFILPFMAIVSLSPLSGFLGCVTFLIIWGTYLPLIRYYSIDMVWMLTLPLAGIMYLLMTWDSAIQHWKGKSAVWKDRTYTR